MEAFERYYTNYFAIDLRRYYEISYDFHDKRYPFIGFMSEPLNSNKRQFITWGLDDVTATEHLHMFSSAIFYTTLFPQVIGKLYGIPAMEDFLAACEYDDIVHVPLQLWQTEHLCDQSVEWF